MEIFGPALAVALILLGLVYKFYFEPRGKTMFGTNVVDPHAGDPQVATIAPQVKQGNVRALGQLLASSGNNWDARGFHLRLLASDASRAALDAWCAQEPTNALAFLVRGRHAITWAWEARGGGSADGVSDDQWRVFGERIQMAGRDLHHATTLDPYDPTPWAELVRVALASNAPPETAWQYFKEATRRDPTSYVAHREMLSYLSRRWHGDYSQMMSFARQAAASAPHGSDLPMILVSAHLDEHNYRCVFDRNEADALTYLYDPAVRGEITTSYQRSLAQPAGVRQHSSIYYSNEAAYCFYLLNDIAPLRTELTRMKGVFTKSPWAFQPTSAADLVSNAKSRAGM